jgi:hypothetical protein
MSIARRKSFIVNSSLFMVWCLVLACLPDRQGAWGLASCYAAPCYGTRMPEKGKIFIGSQVYSIFKRSQEADSGKVRSTQHLFLISYAPYDWFSVDLKVGLGNIKQHPFDSDEVEYSSNFAGGYGFRLKLYDRNQVKAVFGFQHISVHPGDTDVGDIKHKAILDDWQCSFLVSRQFSRLTPYLGAKWSRVDYIHTVQDRRKRVMSDLTKDLGLVAGLDLSLTQDLWLNAEGQFFDGTAAALSLNFSF